MNGTILLMPLIDRAPYGEGARGPYHPYTRLDHMQESIARQAAMPDIAPERRRLLRPRRAAARRCRRRPRRSPRPSPSCRRLRRRPPHFGRERRPF